MYLLIFVNNNFTIVVQIKSRLDIVERGGMCTSYSRPPEEEMAKTHTSAVLGKKIVPSDSKWHIAKPAFKGW